MLLLLPGLLASTILRLELDTRTCTSPLSASGYLDTHDGYLVLELDTRGINGCMATDAPVRICSQAVLELVIKMQEGCSSSDILGLTGVLYNTLLCLYNAILYTQPWNANIP